MTTINPCDIVAVVPCGTNPAFSYTRFPCDFDDPRPDDTKGLPVIVDLQTPVKAEVVNRHRESILAIEAELGIQPSGTFTTVRDRLDSAESLLCSIWTTITSGIVNPVNILWEGSNIVSAVNYLNFTGPGVSVTSTGANSATVSITGGGGGGGGIIIGGDGYKPVQQQLQVVTNGQTSFALSEAPWGNVLLLFIEGIKQELSDYSIIGTQLNWNGSTPLITSDIVEVLYFTSTGSGGGGGGGGVISSIVVADEGTTVQNNTTRLNFVGGSVVASAGAAGEAVITINGSGTKAWQEVFTATNLQTVFTVSNIPISQNSTELFIDGISQTVGIDYTVAGKMITYSGIPALTGGEVVVVKYFEDLLVTTTPGLGNVLIENNKTDGYNIDFNNNSRGINCLDPINSYDIATKHYVDITSGAQNLYEVLAVNNFTGGINIDFQGSTTAINLKAPVSLTDAATKGYVDGYVPSFVTSYSTLSNILSLGNSTGGRNISFGNNSRAINLLSPASANDAATKGYVDGYFGSYNFGSPVSVKDEGTTVQTAVTVMNFTGHSVTASAGGTGVVNIDISSAGMNQEIFTATPGQTVFNLSFTPINQQATEFFIDGLSQAVGIDYTLSGNVVTYIGTFTFIGGEEVAIKYFTNLNLSNVTGLPTVLKLDNSTDGYNIDFEGSSRGIRCLDPVSSQDIATKNYIDGYIESKTLGVVFFSAANNGTDDWLRLAVLVSAEFGNNGKKRKIICTPGNYICKSQFEIPSGTQIELLPGCDISCSIPNPSTIAPYRGPFVATYKSPTITVNLSLASNISIGDSVISVTATTAPAIGDVLVISDNSSPYQGYEIINVTGSSSPYSLTLDHAVGRNFTTGSAPLVVWGKNKNIVIEGNGCTIHGASERMLSLACAWNCKISGFNIDGYNCTEYVCSLDVGGAHSVFERINVYNVPLNMFGIVLEYSYSHRIQNCFSSGRGILFGCYGESHVLEQVNAYGSLTEGLGILVGSEWSRNINLKNFNVAHCYSGVECRAAIGCKIENGLIEGGNLGLTTTYSASVTTSGLVVRSVTVRNFDQGCIRNYDGCEMVLENCFIGASSGAFNIFNNTGSSLSFIGGTIKQGTYYVAISNAGDLRFQNKTVFDATVQGPTGNSQLIVSAAGSVRLNNIKITGSPAYAFVLTGGTIFTQDIEIINTPGVGVALLAAGARWWRQYNSSFDSCTTPFSGTGQKNFGTATLTGVTPVTLNFTLAKASNQLFFNRKVVTGTLGHLSGSISAGVGGTIVSSGTETSTVEWEIK